MQEKAKQKEKQSKPAPEEKIPEAAQSKASKKEAGDKEEKQAGKKETKNGEHKPVPKLQAESSRGTNQPRKQLLFRKPQRTSEKIRWMRRSGQTKFTFPHCDICPQDHMSKGIWQLCMF